MKEFVIRGPNTNTIFEIEDDEMVVWNVVKIKDYEDMAKKNLRYEMTEPESGDKEIVISGPGESPGPEKGLGTDRSIKTGKGRCYAPRLKPTLLSTTASSSNKAIQQARNW